MGDGLSNIRTTFGWDWNHPARAQFLMLSSLLLGGVLGLVAVAELEHAGDTAVPGTVVVFVVQMATFAVGVVVAALLD